MSTPIKLLTAEEVAAKLRVKAKWVYADRTLPRIEIQRFLDADPGVSFSEWLRWKKDPRSERSLAQ